MPDPTAPESGRLAPAGGGRWFQRPEALLALVVLVSIAIDVVRVGFLADDFIFLDAARRQSAFDQITGRFGVWPWYRPLSCALYFWIVAHAGALSLLAARVISLACLYGVLLLTWRIGRRLVGEPAATIGVVLFATYEIAKFLAAWSSGFQDLLALLLVLAAVDAVQAGRSGRALGFAVLAPFAKEIGFIALPLLAASRWLMGPRERPRRWLGTLAATALGVLLVHVAVRLMWPAGAQPPDTERADFPATVAEVLRAFVSGPATWHWADTLRAGVAGILAFLLLDGVPARDAGAPAPAAAGRGALALLLIAGLAPVIVFHLLDFSHVFPYQFFPAAPWLALALGLALARLPRPLWGVGLPLLVAWNTAGLAYRPVDLGDAANWSHLATLQARARWHWPEATRLSQITGSLGDDLRAAFAARPDSLVILYTALPPGIIFQTGDGPATRELMGDPTVRAYWINAAPDPLDPDRLAIVTFDFERLHLVPLRPATSEALARAMGALVNGRPRSARAFLAFASPDSARLDHAYLEAAATLVERGPEAYRDALATAGLGDTLGAAPARIADPLAAFDPELGRAFEAVLRQPRSAPHHAALAGLLRTRGNSARAALELRIAVSLDPGRAADRAQLDRLMRAFEGE